jgi:hypothetical protein
MKILVMSALILSTLTSAALADPQNPSTKTLVKLTDAQLDQIVAGAQPTFSPAPGNLTDNPLTLTLTHILFG